MSDVTVVKSNEAKFVKPYFIAALGCDGVTSQEIADSIGMKKHHLHTLIQKLQSFGDLPEAREDTVSIDGIHKALIYLVKTDDAKFIVTQSSTSAGRGYCRFLIECEKALLAAPPAMTIDSAMALANQAYAALLVERAEKEKALAQAAYQDKALTSSQVTNGKLTRAVHKLEKENHKLNLAVCGQLEYMTIKQFLAAVGIKATKCTNQLVSELSRLSDVAGLEVKKLIIGDEKWPSKAFQAAFLNENVTLIKKMIT
jgi:hypothetical protein